MAKPNAQESELDALLDTRSPMDIDRMCWMKCNLGELFP